MLECLNHLENNLGIDFSDNKDKDYLLSMIVYEEKDDDVSFYDLIAGYLSLCKEVDEDYKELFRELESNSPDSKIGIMMKSIKLEDIVKDEDKYEFKITAERPVPFSIKLQIEECSYNNKVESPYIFDTYSHFEISIDPSHKNDKRALAIAAIFNEYVNHSALYDLVSNMCVVNDRLIYTAHTDESLPICVEFSQKGQVELFYSGGNNRECIMKIQPNHRLSFSSSEAMANSLDFLYNFYYWSPQSKEPIWVLNNIYVNRNAITNHNLLEQLDEDTEILDKLFKDSGFEKTLSYQDMFYDVQTSYFVYGDGNELIEIEDYTDVEEQDTYYKFIFDDDSSVRYPKDKVVVVCEDLDDSYEESSAIKSLNLKTGY